MKHLAVVEYLLLLLIGRWAVLPKNMCETLNFPNPGFLGSQIVHLGWKWLWHVVTFLWIPGLLETTKWIVIWVRIEGSTTSSIIKLISCLFGLTPTCQDTSGSDEELFLHLSAVLGVANEDPYLEQNVAQPPSKVIAQPESAFHTPSPRVKPGCGAYSPSPPVAWAAFWELVVIMLITFDSLTYVLPNDKNQDLFVLRLCLQLVRMSSLTW